MYENDEKLIQDCGQKTRKGETTQKT